MNNILQESSLSRLVQHMNEHDCGIISAARYARKCGEGEPYTIDENNKRMRSLQSKLHDKRYDVTALKGNYIENFGSNKEKIVGEKVFFVVDSEETLKLFSDLKQLGEFFDQDSILFIPKQNTTNENTEIKSMLYGTNHCENGYPGYGISKIYTQRVMGQAGQFFTTVRNRPFVFKEDLNIEHYPLPQGFLGRWSCNATANTKWELL